MPKKAKSAVEIYTARGVVAIVPFDADSHSSTMLAHQLANEINDMYNEKWFYPSSVRTV